MTEPAETLRKAIQKDDWQPRPTISFRDRVFSFLFLLVIILMGVLLKSLG